MVLVRTAAVAGGFALVVAALLAVALVVCVGVGRLRQAGGNRGVLRERLRAVAPYAAVLAAVFGGRKVFREWFWALSDVIGYEATGLFYAIEGDLAAGVQAAIPDVAALYFAFVYMFGYAVVVFGPLALYLFAESLRHLKTVLVAYTINYAVAVVAYTLVIARGPRIASESTQGVIQEFFPYFTLLTGQVNSPTNVFPSLHTSLSVTVLVVAVLTRREFPRWLAITAVLTGSIVVATVYLGIHWLVDIAAGICLAVASVWLARRFVARVGTQSRDDRAGVTEHAQD
ncbi:phosphatase PAP2 family protein [Natronomonas sp.]|uniref:phosphatase PAP2 family protein n=1 Tax=Natronomonas sp. TaxID=2184060 RepID=UPI00261CA2AA|nr:phosphatase PAP2 family protein [Natronomonas sp.]